MSDKNKLVLFTALSGETEGYQSYLDRIDPKKLQRINNTVAGMRHGLHTVAPITCMGPEKCSFSDRCPIPERNPETGKLDYGKLSDYPIGQACLLESFYMRQKIVDYVRHLDVDPEDPVEMSIVNELALIDLLKNRALMILGTGDRDGQGRDFMRIDITGFSEGGKESTTSTLHPAADYIDKLERRREKWLEKLVQTRKSQAELRLKTGALKEESRLLVAMHGIATALAEMDLNRVNALAELLPGEDDGSVSLDGD